MPLAPGGTADLLPRMVGEKLTLKWGQPVIVENKPGGALHLATEHVFRAEPDGYTLLLAPQGPMVLSPSLYSKLGYDPAAFMPVTIMARLPYVFVVQSESAGVDHSRNWSHSRRPIRTRSISARRRR